MNTQNEQIEFHDLLRVISKRRYLIILGTWLCVMGAYVGTTNIVPTYQSSIKLLVSQRSAAVRGGVVQTAGESYQSIMVGERLAKTYAEIIQGRTVAEKIKETAKLKSSAGNPIGKIRAVPIRDTQLIRVTVNDTNPKRAQQIASAVGVVFADLVDEIEGADDVVPLIRVSTIEPAVVPTAPINQKHTRDIVLGLFAGLVVSGGLAFLLEYLDTSIKSADEAESLLGVPTMGLIHEGREASERGFVTVNHPISNIAESFRSLRTNIQYLNFDSSIKVLAVTSSIPEEGKTTVSGNLAASLAQGDAKVLLIDGDLRRPKVHEFIEDSSSPGLSSVLAGTAGLETAVISSGVENLWVLPAGPIPPNPAELLGSEQMRAVIAEAREKFDFVVFDSPPAVLVTDAAVISRLVDGFILVIWAGKTGRHTVLQAKAILERVNAKLRGVVLNGMSRKHQAGGYYYNQGYYGTPQETSKTTSVDA